MRKSASFFVLSIISLLTACTDSSSTQKNEPSEPVVETAPGDELRKYYFPVDSFATPQVYEYVSAQGNNMYWVMAKKLEGGKTFMLCDFYVTDSTGASRKIEVLKEEIRADGAYVVDYSEFKMDETKTIFEAKAKMKTALLFKWNWRESESLVWSIESTIVENPSFLQTMDKTRTYTGQTEKIEFGGDSLEAILFTDVFHLEMMNTTANRNKTYDFSQTSYYAEGVGLYKYVRTFDGIETTYTLNRILSEQEWLSIQENN